jgi:hypothetical protein
MKANGGYLRARGSASIGLELSLRLGFDWLDLFGSSLAQSIDDLNLSALLKSCHMPSVPQSNSASCGKR